MNHLQQIGAQHRREFWQQQVCSISEKTSAVSLRDIPFRIGGTNEIIELIEGYQKPAYALDDYSGPKTTRCCATGTCSKVG